MKNQALEQKLQHEVLNFIDGRRSLQLATIDSAGLPYASYAPFALGNACLYVLISDVALHAINLRQNPRASVLIIEDEASADEVFARVRLNYQVEAEWLQRGTPEWAEGIALLGLRHGERINGLSGMEDFRLFRLQPKGGRYIKDFGRAYRIRGDSLVGEALDHLSEGHRPVATA